MTKHTIGRPIRRTATLPLALGAALMIGAPVSAKHASGEPFKVANIHFETNASACDMGIQILFDTDGITAGSVRDPDGKIIYRLASKKGMKDLGGQTEGFLEGIEPQITELVDALGCEPSDDEEEIAIQDLFDAFPEGDYRFDGKGDEGRFSGVATLTYAIPAGPVITTPMEGDVVPDAPLVIEWEQVTHSILTANPDLGPVHIVGYHVIVVEGGGEALPQLDIDVPATETRVTIPEEYLKPATFYDFEVLATEESGNQTISEGFFCTVGLSPCVEP